MIHVLTDVASGGTFLTWSIHYLSGIDEYFLLQRNQWITLTNNPISIKNAHNFIPNQPNRIFNCTKQQFIDFAETLSNTASNNHHILYFHQFTNKETTKTAVNYSNINASKLIVVDASKSKFYHCSYRKRTPWLIGYNKQSINDDEIFQWLTDTFFKDAKLKWNELGLNNIWDRREFIALNFKPLNQEHIYSNIDKTKKHYLIQSSELWTSMDSGIINLFDYLNIGIDQSRLENWQHIYYSWRFLHHQPMTFSTYFETIIEGILHNYDIDLTRFNLDIEQEAAIQHILIYNYNLNLKTWQLEKFTNTKQLHNLLEPNRHPLGSKD